MNRTSFLSTLPFLHEVPSNDWPPNISEDTGTTRRQFLFRDHNLSLEPLYPDSEDPLGPAFFVPPPQRQEPFDAGMCKIEMVLFTTPKKKTPYKLALRTPNKSPSAASKRAMEVEYKEFIAFMYLDDRVYQVDLDKIDNVVLKGSLQSRSTPPAPPPCLLIQFPNCCFRIFSIVGDPANQYAILNSGKSEISSVLPNNNNFIGGGDNYYPFPAKALDGLTSPYGGSSTAPSSEPGQPESALQHETARTSSSEDTRKSSSIPDMEHRCQAKTQKCQTSLHAAQEDLDALRRLLKPSRSPPTQSSSSSSSTTVEEVRTKASNLLTSVADNVTASYCTQEELLAAAHGYDKDMDSTRTQLNKLFKAVWPGVKRPNKKARTSSHGRSSGSKKHDPTLDPKTKEHCIQHVEKLLSQHKQALQSKYALAMLPTRG